MEGKVKTTIRCIFKSVTLAGRSVLGLFWPRRATRLVSRLDPYSVFVASACLLLARFASMLAQTEVGHPAHPDTLAPILICRISPLLAAVVGVACDLLNIFCNFFLQPVFAPLLVHRSTLARARSCAKSFKTLRPRFKGTTLQFSSSIILTFWV